MARPKAVHPVAAARAAARDRKEGRGAFRRLEGAAERRERKAPPPDDFFESMRSGDLLVEDLPVSHKKHDVLTTATEEAFTEAGPTDLDAARARVRGHSYVSPADAVAQERGLPSGQGFQDMEAELRRAARADWNRLVNEGISRGMSRQDAESEASREIRVQRAAPLPGRRVGPTKDLAEGEPEPELMAESIHDARIDKGQPLRREIPQTDLDGEPANIVRDASEETLRELDGGVRRTAPPPA